MIPSRRRSWSALVIASALLFSACQATADVTTSESAGRTETDSSSAPQESSDTTEVESEQTDTETGEPDTPPAETDDAGSLTPRYELQGELPLTVADVNSLIQFIEDDTGRAFLRPPVIVAQTTDEFIAGLSDDLDDFNDDADVTVRALQALGLTTQGVAEVTQAFTDLLLSPEGILGYYDSETDELYVPIDALGGDEFRSLLVHELVHALDGQHADLNVIDELIELGDETGDYELVLSLQAVAEGRATSVQNRWQAENGFTPEDPDDLGAIEDVPPAMVLSLSIPYVFGEQYIEGNGGAAETWELLETPPPSSEEFIVFGGIPAGEAIIDVPVPAADGPVLDEVVYGAADILIWLIGESLDPNPEMLFPTFTAIDGWAGGSAVLWGDDTESCMRIAIAGDNEQDLGEIRDAIDLWVQADANRSVETVDDLVVVTGCAPFVP